MKKTIQIPQGNEFSLFVPFVVLSKNGREEASAALWNNVQVVVRMTNKSEDIPHTTNLQEQYVIISFDNSLKLGSYDVIISGEYEGRNVSAPLNNLFSVTNWADGNYAEFVVGQPIECPTQVIIGQFNTTQDIIDLTEELRAALAAAEAAKEEYEEKVEELSDVAQESTLTQGIADIRGDIAGISIDTSTIAKQGTNASATLTATQTAATNAYASAEAAKTATIDGNDTAIGVAKEIRGEVGTGSDTAAETGTLFAVVKWVKDKVKSIFNLIGSPASGQPATLFAAIAAGGGGGGGDAQESTSQAILAKIGSAGSGQSATLFGAIGDVVQQVVQGVINGTSINITYSGVVYQQPYSGNSPLEVYAYLKYAISIIDDYIVESPNIQNVFALSNLALLEYLKMNKLKRVLGIQSFSNCKAKEMDFPLFENSYHSTFSSCTNLIKLSIPSFNPTSGQFSEFTGDNNLIDIITGAAFDHNIAFFNTWNPTNALSSSSTSLVYEGETFSSNLEKLLYNIREHFAANLPDRTGQTAITITFHANMKTAINGDTATAQAFTSKNYTIA